MPNDAKLGLVVGVVVVIAVAVVFFRKEAPASPPGDQAAAIARPIAPDVLTPGRTRLPLALTTAQPRSAPGDEPAEVPTSTSSDLAPP
jgi:hypothetical protein